MNSSPRRHAIRPELAAFAARLQLLRHRRGVSKYRMAKGAGLSDVMLGFLEGARCCPSASTLDRLANVFGVTMDELWKGIGRCDPVILQALEDGQESEGATDA